MEGLRIIHMVYKLKPTNAVFLVSKSNMIIKTFPQMYKQGPGKRHQTGLGSSNCSFQDTEFAAKPKAGNPTLTRAVYSQNI